MKIRRKIKVYGIVQGIGFRPFVKRAADRFRICGDVCNKGSYVEIHAEGAAEDLQKFRKSLTEDAPSVSHIVRIEEHPEVPHGETEFRIIESVAESGEMFVSPDLAVCPECKKELFDPKNRRYLHPFINCTNCGPRLTILDSMPYDRVRTTMRKFSMCKECSYEYTHPSTRRYHAQPVCCNADGPELMLIENRFSEDGNNSVGNQMTKTQAIQITKTNQRDATLKKADLAEADTSDGEEAEKKIANRDRVLKRAREILRKGGILAVKGIGGFHLACDAANEEAVQRLRTLKKRPMKPFAVMMRDLETVKRECEILPGEEEILDGVEKPILILKKKQCADVRKEEMRDGQQIPGLAASVAPDNPTVGVMLPYAPVQLLLFQYPDGKPMTDMLVMTSGNPSGAPICRTTEEAVRYLSSMCDAILTNNRDILTRADDSVMQFEAGKPYMIRRSRGYAPLPFAGQEELKGKVLAVGGELKNTFVLAKNELYYPSAYIGDLEDVRSIDALTDTIPRMERLLEIQPEIVACDLHPGYHSTAFAKKYAKDHNLSLFQVQHHYAHILSCMAENDYEGKVIGISFDGTGYGTDGTVWGGEFLLASPENFVRLGSIKPFLQAGGDAASKEGWRIAVSLLYRMHAREQKTGMSYSHNNSYNINNIEETLTDEQKKQVREAVREDVLALRLCDERSLSVELFMLEHNMNCVESTSAGRLFDAVSAILGIRRKSTFEGEASMALEYASDPDAAAITHPEMILIRDEKTEQDNDTKVQKKWTKGEAGENPETNPEREIGCSGRSFIFRDDDLIRKLLEEIKKGTSTSVLAGGFHTYLAEMILEGARYCRDLTGVTTVALSGGCFQNLLLLRKCKKLLREDGFQVLTHSLVPPNDGGIALGQAWAAMRRCRIGD